MQTKTKSGRVLELPSPEEDAQITAAALTDTDNLPLTDEELKQFRRTRGRPQGSEKKRTGNASIRYGRIGAVQSNRKWLANTHQ